MRVTLQDVPEAVADTLRGWGWEVAEAGAEAILTGFADRLEIRAAETAHADDVIFFPLREAELRTRIELAKARRGRLTKRLHDLRSPLNAIQGYAEMIVETAEGDALRFASNIRTASETLTGRLELFRDEGV